MVKLVLGDSGLEPMAVVVDFIVSGVSTAS